MGAAVGTVCRSTSAMTSVEEVAVHQQVEKSPIMCCTRPCLVAEGKEAVVEVVGEGQSCFFEVTLDKLPGTCFGLHVDIEPGYDFLPVTSVKPGGLAEAWNRRLPECRVEPGDRILEVNGVRGDSQQMAAACNADHVLKLVMQRRSRALGETPPSTARKWTIESPRESRTRYDLDSLTASPEPEAELDVDDDFMGTPVVGASPSTWQGR
mmetsp:Transcript_10347/g.26773  ORF Transcript_10347/g.26773 Transcript_10347/m.26773 type:complete len:209 (-) Transcript_10347:481-1107(-)